VTVGEAEARLRTMLREAGLRLDRLDPEPAWRTFLSFAGEPVEGIGEDPDDDMCLFECGVYDWSDGKGPRFNWGFCRQFIVYSEAGEYDHMEQLHCDFFFTVADEVERIRENGLWSRGDLDTWARQIEGLEAFQAVLGLVPLESRVEQWEV
jgi:hypothetical protein